MEFTTYIRFAVALLLVLGLIAGIAWLVKRFGLSGRIAPGSGTPAKNRRLSVVEACPVDAKRRLVLVRRDNTEHLILLTANGSGVIVERDIVDRSRGNKPRRGTFKDALKRETGGDQYWPEDDDEAEEPPSTETRDGLGFKR